MGISPRAGTTDACQDPCALLDAQLDARPDRTTTRAAELATTGVAGLSTFEGPHDVFLPLAATAGAGIDVDLMTNVAIATPRSPLRLAHAAYDLQLMSGGRFRLGLGSQVRPHMGTTPEEQVATDPADRVCCYFPGYDVPPAQLGELVAALRDRRAGLSVRSTLRGVRAGVRRR